MTFGHTRRDVARLCAWAFAAPLISGGRAFAQAKEKVTVRFTWKLKGEYAPLFVALDKGYYAAEGLDVDLAEGNGAINVIKGIAAGNEPFGYGPANTAAEAASQGVVTKVVALYQAATPMALIAFPDVPLKTPKDIEGKTMAITVGENFSTMLAPFCKINNVDINKINRVQMDMSARNAQFMTRKVDLLPVFMTNEVPILEKRAGVKFNALKAGEFGLSVVGASFFVNPAYAKAKPDVVRKLIRATAKGYEDAMKDPAQAADAMNKYMKVKEDPDVLLAQVKATMADVNVIPGKPLGWQDDKVWKANIELLHANGSIKEIREDDAFYTNEFLM